MKECRNGMEPIAKQSTRDQVIATLRKAIFNGDLKEGEELIQEEIAKKLNVSRMPVREAFYALEREGLLLTNQNRRVTVKGFTRDDIQDHYDIRAMLEGEAAARASLKDFDKQELLEIQQDIENAVANRQVNDYIVANEHFHRIIWKASESERLQSFLDQMWNGLPPHLAEMVEEQMIKSIKEHQVIVSAILEGNADKAREATEAHIRRSMTDFLENY
ncbi:GntR family transcriptional regulator [Sporosarcina cyprini]|uniref:GntR family transcriptional regulator n=1 Tax=Sporosarcina cyprini TaxID=2910523 RepID=UPI001EDE2083|nr:GntR family transcriptional regulator [Sporosarcina cyprini]MCG3088227.1 GntR family transcriptional regulator [Sporosarcina cyprini]